MLELDGIVEYDSKMMLEVDVRRTLVLDGVVEYDSKTIVEVDVRNRWPG